MKEFALLNYIPQTIMFQSMCEVNRFHDDIRSKLKPFERPSNADLIGFIPLLKLTLHCIF